VLTCHYRCHAVAAEQSQIPSVKGRGEKKKKKKRKGKM